MIKSFSSSHLCGPTFALINLSFLGELGWIQRRFGVNEIMRQYRGRGSLLTQPVLWRGPLESGVLLLSSETVHLPHEA